MNNATRILIIEDQFSDYELAQREIQKAVPHCRFERAEKEAEFLKALENFQPDVILSDYKLPHFDGMKVLELAQQQHLPMPVIIWTGAMSEDVAVECMKHGASNYVLKENIKRLAPAVSHALKEREEILERKQAEERFQAIFENAPVGIFQSTPQGRFIHVNAAMARIYGYDSPQEMIGSINNIASQIYIEAHDRNQFTQLLQTNNSVENFEMRNIRKDGSVFWTSTSARAVRDEADTILYYEGFLLDITDRKLAEAKLWESEARYHGIFENAQDAIFVETFEGDILDVNPRACEIYGYTREEFLQKKVVDIVPSREYIINLPEAHLVPGHAVETVNVRANGEHFPVELSGSLYKLGDRRLFLIILRDITERKAADRQMRQQEQHFRALIENGMDNISLLAKDGTLLWENPAVNNTLGYKHNEFVKRNIFELMHPDDMAWTSELFAKVVGEPGSQQRGIFRLRHRDGTWHWMEAAATNMLDEPSVNAIVINYRDVTQRKNAEEELRESQIKYRNLVETSHDLIWSVDAEGRITFINHAAQDIYGYEPEELIGHSFLEFLDPEANADLEIFKETIGGANEYHGIESRVRHRDGRRFTLSANSIVLRDEQGNITGATGTSRNITKRKQSEEDLREERNLLRTLIDNLPDRIYAMDTQGRKTLSNIADWRASGKKTMEEVIGKTDFDLYPPELAGPFWQSDKAVLDSGQPLINFEEPGLDFNGNRVSILTTKIPLRNAEGNIIGLVGVGRDITERKQAEARIKDLLSLNEKMLNYSPLGILTYKLSGECIFANENAAFITGATVENLLSQNFHSIEPWKKSGLYALVQKAIATKTFVVADVHHTSSFGKDVWITAHCVTFTSSDEEHVLLSILDITERKQAEEKLLHSQQELTEAQRLAKIGSWSFDTLKNQVHWSDELYRIFGIEREAFGHSYDAYLELIHAEDRSKIEQINNNALQRGASFDAEYRIITSTGEVKTIREVGYARTSEDGQISSLFGTAQDITERKRSELERQALFEIMQGLAITNDLQEFLELIHVTIAKVISAENFFVVLHHPDTGLFEEIYSVDQYDAPAPPSRLEKSITSYVFRSGEPLLLKAHDFDDLFSHGEVELVGAPAASWLGAPLKTSAGTIGVIAVQDYQDPNRYSEHDKDFLASIATQVALAVERKQADIELQQKNDDLGLISAVNEAIVRGQNLNAAIELLTKELRRIFSAIGSTIYMLSPDKQWITMEQYSFNSTAARNVEGLLGFKIPRVEFFVKPGGHFHRVIVSKQSAITTEPQEIQNWLAEFAETRFLPPLIQKAVRKLIPQLYKLLNIRSTIAVPLISGQEVIGVLDVSGSDLFTANDLKRIENIGEQLTAVLQRQQVNEKIRKSEEFLQGVQDSLSAHIAILDERGTIVYVNAAWCEFGKQNGLQDANCCIGRNYLNTCESATGPDADVAHQVATSIREVFTGKQKQISVEYPCHSPQEKRWFTVHVTCFDDGEQKWIILAHENITTRMMAEAALKESTAQLRTLFEATPDAIMLIDPHENWTIVDCNSAACKINGYTREELIGQPVEVLNTENSTAESNAEYFKRIQNVDVLRYETRHVHKNGTIFPIEVSTSLIRLGERDLVLGIDRDITERKRSEAAEREQRILAEALRDTSQILSSSLDYGEVLDHILAAVGQVVPHDAATIMLIEEGVARVVRSQGYDKRATNEAIMGVRLSLADTTNLRTMLETKQPAVVYDTHSYPGWKRMETTDWLRSNVGAPISIGGEVIGFILLDCETPGFFTTVHAERLEAFANQAAVAIHNADLLQQAQNEIAERKRAEEALHAEQEKVRNYLDIAGVIMLAQDPKGTITLINQKGCEILGFSADEIVGKNWINTFLPETTREETQEAFQQLISGKLESVGYYENTVLCRDGKERLIAWHNTLLRDEQGTVISSLSSGEDITERKRAEEELRASEERFRQLADNIEEVFWMTDAETGRELYISPAGERIWGRSLDQLFNDPNAFIQTIAMEDQPDVLRALKREKNGERVEIEYRVAHPDGSVHWVWDRAFPIFDENGKVKTLAGIAADVTKRRQAEDALRESEARFSNAFEYAPIGIALVGLDGMWLKVNQALCVLLGYAEHEMISKTFQEITHPDDLNMDLQFVEETLTGKIVSYQLEKRYIHKSGKIVWALLSVSLVRDQKGKPQYFVSQIQDITERKQAEDEIGRRAKETYALLETSLALTNLDLKAILQTVGNSAKALFAADGCRVFLMQPDGETLRCVLAIQENATAFSDLKIKLGEGVTGAVASSGKAEIINNMLNDPRAVQVPGTDEEEEAIMFAPLKERDHTVGVLSIRRAGAERPFQPVDLELLEAFASMAASAVSNARLFEEAQQRLDELEAIYENGLAVSQLLEPREIGTQIIETFTHYLSWHHVTIRLLRPETDQLEVIAFHLPGLNEDQKSEVEDHFNQMIGRVGQGLSGWVVQTGIPLRTGNVRANPHYVNTQAGIQSGLYMPLKIGDRAIGVISVESKAPDAFTEQDERLLATLASQAAIAFENARLYQAAHQELLERTRAQAALWASETHYRELADSITDILFELDYSLQYTHWNKASEMYTGIPAEDAIGKTIQELWGTSAQPLGREEIYQNVLRERQAKTFEIDVVLRGQKRSLDVTAYPSTRGVSVVARDVTERKLDETLIQKRVELMEYSAHHSLEELMQRTVDEISKLTDSHIGFLSFIAEDQKTISLRAWSTETLQAVGAVEGKDLHHSVDTAGVWADAFRQRRPIIHNDYETLPNKKGLPEYHPSVIRELVIPIVRDDEIGAILGIGNKPEAYTQREVELAERFADYAWDIIERRQMEAALAEERNQLAKRVEQRTADLSRANSNLARALRVKDEFLANMSHELRTPLNAILGLSESLSEQVAGPLNEKQQKYLNTINESGHHLLSLINDILDLAKIEAGQITLDINKVDINSVCQASLRMIKQLAQKKNQEVLFEMDNNLGLMWADERRLKQMIVNLLSNAVKFTPESGKLGLEVHGDPTGNRVLITVWDKGIGISEQDMDRLFKPFVQLDSGLAREATGTGLGLALVAQMARLHGGSVSLESHLGEGSQFTIMLPWEPALTVDASTRLRNTGKFRAIDPNATNKPTILLIEDTREVVMMLVDYLEMSGFKMVTAQDGADGIQQAKLSHPNLILMDVMMPGMDGFETTRKLRLDPQFKDTPIIALTALAMPSDRQRCLDAGMDEYISKPVNLKALVKLIRSILLDKEEPKPK